MFANISIMVLIAAFGAAAGAFYRSRKTAKLNNRIFELEKEMLGNHKEILRLEAELSKREIQIPGETPVISFPSGKNHKAAK